MCICDFCGSHVTQLWYNTWGPFCPHVACPAATCTAPALLGVGMCPGMLTIFLPQCEKEEPTPDKAGCDCCAHATGKETLWRTAALHQDDLVTRLHKQDALRNAFSAEVDGIAAACPATRRSLCCATFLAQ